MTDVRWTALDQAWEHESEELFEAVVRKATSRMSELRCDVSFVISPLSSDPNPILGRP